MPLCVVGKPPVGAGVNGGVILAVWELRATMSPFMSAAASRSCRRASLVGCGGWVRCSWVGVHSSSGAGVTRGLGGTWMDLSRPFGVVWGDMITSFTPSCIAAGGVGAVGASMGRVPKGGVACGMQGDGDARYCARGAKTMVSGMVSGLAKSLLKKREPLGSGGWRGGWGGGGGRLPFILGWGFHLFQGMVQSGWVL